MPRTMWRRLEPGLYEPWLIRGYRITRQSHDKWSLTLPGGVQQITATLNAARAIAVRHMNGGGQSVCPPTPTSPPTQGDKHVHPPTTPTGRHPQLPDYNWDEGSVRPRRKGRTTNPRVVSMRISDTVKDSVNVKFVSFRIGCQIADRLKIRHQDRVIIDFSSNTLMLGFTVSDEDGECDGYSVQRKDNTGIATTQMQLKSFQPHQAKRLLELVQVGTMTEIRVVDCEWGMMCCSLKHLDTGVA